MSTVDSFSDPAGDPVVQVFERRFGREPQLVVRAPGRVALLGAHVDRADGLVLPAALDRAVFLAAAPLAEPVLRVLSVDLSKDETVPLAPTPVPADRRGDWTDLPRAVAWSLREDGHLLPGLEVAFGGDLPMGAGLSSSAAVEVAFTLAWEGLGRFVLPRLDRARIGVRAENGFLGVESGPMDQAGIVLGAADCFVLYDCRSSEHEQLPVRPGLAVVVADTGTRRELARSEFNRRRAECREALQQLRQRIPDLVSLRDLGPEALDRHGPKLDDVLHRRARHVVEEIARVRAGALALREGDLTAFGDLVRRSHVSSRDLFETSTDELDVLAEAAWEESACYGARFMGGGFGGVVAALVDEAAADTVADTMATRFERRFGRRPEIHRGHLGDGARSWGAAAWAPRVPGL